MSRFLTEHSIDHVVLERGEVANSWRRERWDSLRLLTPNWQSRLPGYPYHGSDPDGFMTMPEVVEFISGFAAAISAPGAHPHDRKSVRRIDGGYHVATDQAKSAAVAWCSRAAPRTLRMYPKLRQAVPAGIECLTAFDYRNPEQLPQGGVLIVGASATGVQLADEIHRSGRPVTLSVGEHVRLPSTYRGRDVLWWMEASGVWNQRYDEIDDLERARGLPSPQLIGTPEHATLDLNVLRAAGVEIVGRLAAVRDGRALFSGGLRNQFALADLKMRAAARYLRRLGAPVALDVEVGPSGAFRADACTRIGAAVDRPAQRGDPLDRLGHRLSSRLPLARGAGDQSQGRATSRRGSRGGCAGPVRDRIAGVTAAKVDVHLRCGG